VHVWFRTRERNGDPAKKGGNQRERERRHGLRTLININPTRASEKSRPHPLPNVPGIVAGSRQNPYTGTCKPQPSTPTPPSRILSTTPPPVGWGNFEVRRYTPR
ncbi:unnamed protein product, partial [Ectocarpus sp. 12 AP-2014]